MIVYEVNLEVEPGCAEAFRAWLGGHVRDMLGLPGFLSAEILRVDSDSEDSAAWTVHYRMLDMEALEHYLAEHAPSLRAEGVTRFGRRFSARRRVLHCETLQPG